MLTSTYLNPAVSSFPTTSLLVAGFNKDTATSHFSVVYLYFHNAKT